MTIPDARTYRGFSDLSRAQIRGRDYEITVRRRPKSRIAVIAPHGGQIEDGTSEIARAVAGDDFHLYLFEGIRPWHNYTALHLTSTRFDEPECLDLISDCDHVIAMHGCAGSQPKVLLGGLDTTLKHRLANALGEASLAANTDGHKFPGLNPANIVNRGKRGMGVQLEITHPLRREGDLKRLSSAIRMSLFTLLDGSKDEVPIEARTLPEGSGRKPRG